MPVLLQQVADILTEAAGWNRVEPDESGVYSFFIDGGLDFELLSPDNRLAVLRADIGRVPSVPEEADQKLAEMAKLAVGCLKKRRSILAVSNGRFELQATFPIYNASPIELTSFVPRLVKDFLNDLAWWKKQFGGESSQAFSASMFNASAFSFNQFTR